MSAVCMIHDTIFEKEIGLKSLQIMVTSNYKTNAPQITVDKNGKTLK